jgi:hypothetical protein
MLRMTNKLCDMSITFAEVREFDATRGILRTNDDQAQADVLTLVDECQYSDKDACYVH